MNVRTLIKNALTLSSLGLILCASSVHAQNYPNKPIRFLVGFGAGVVSPVVFGAVLDFSGGGRMATDASTWGWSWMSLGLVALLGPLATFYLQRTTPTQTR